MAGLLLQGLKKAYGDVEILKGIDLSIADGEFMVLVGPSGCGKSTLLRCLAGLEEISAGHLHIGERRVNDVAPKDRDIAMVFQSYALYPHMTVRDNLGFGLRIRKMDKAEIERRIAEAARLLGLETLLDRYPKQLSGGQRQRVAMGRAIVRRPEVFLFDEPLSNLDAALRVQMRAELTRLHQRLKTTMIYVTHDQVEAMTLADRIMVLNGGEVQQVGAPLELYHRPANRFVAGFIGSPAMNFLPGKMIGEEDGQGIVEVAGARVRLPAGRRLPAVGQQLVVGMRPEHLSIGDGGAAGLDGTIEVVEPMGFDAHVHVRLGAAPQKSGSLQVAGGDPVVIARVESARVAHLTPGGRLTLVPDPSQLHLFDAERERAIGAPTASDAVVPTVAAAGA